MFLTAAEFSSNSAVEQVGNDHSQRKKSSMCRQWCGNHTGLTDDHNTLTGQTSRMRINQKMGTWHFLRCFIFCVGKAQILTILFLSKITQIRKIKHMLKKSRLLSATYRTDFSDCSRYWRCPCQLAWFTKIRFLYWWSSKKEAKM